MHGMVHTIRGPELCDGKAALRIVDTLAEFLVSGAILTNQPGYIFRLGCLLPVSIALNGASNGLELLVSHSCVQTW